MSHRLAFYFLAAGRVHCDQDIAHRSLNSKYHSLNHFYSVAMVSDAWFFDNSNLSATETDFSIDLERSLKLDLLFRTIGISVILIGIPANTYVVWRMLRLAKKDFEKYANGTGVCLLTMAIADILSLLLISVQNVPHAYTVPLNFNTSVKRIICKALIFSTRTATSVSIWCWVLMSSLRFLAIRHPIYHYRLWNLPYRAIAFIVLLSSLTNAWLLAVVDFEQSGCVQNASSVGKSMNRYLHLVECVWSFCIPVIMIGVMDSTVLLYGPHNFLSTDTSMRKDPFIRQRSKKAKSALWKWLFITFIDVLLNMPENIIGLLTLLEVQLTDVSKDVEFHYTAHMTAKVLYVSQFAFNALYLALFIFDSSTKPRTFSVPNNTLSEAHAAAKRDNNVVFRPRSQSHKETSYAEKSENLPLSSSWHQLETIEFHFTDHLEQKYD